MSLVLGVGAGVFVFFFFLALFLLIGILIYRSRYAKRIIFYLAVSYGIICLVLFATPKGKASPRPDTGYDKTIVGMAVITCLLGLGFLYSLNAMFSHFIYPSRYARPLIYHIDVDRRL